MIELTGDFWELREKHKPDALVCTTNNVLMWSGKLVMGAGIAAEFNQRFPNLSQELGAMIACMSKINPEYGVLAVDLGTECVLALQTKYHWKKPSPLPLIIRSIKKLEQLCTEFGFNNIHMTRPGCGMGGLHWENDVKPVIKKKLDDRFKVINI